MGLMIQKFGVHQLKCRNPVGKDRINYHELVGRQDFWSINSMTTSHMYTTFHCGSTGLGARWDIANLDISQMSVPSNSSVFFWLETYFRVLSWGPVIYLMELANFNPDFCWLEFYRFQVEREQRKLFQPTVNNINPSTNIICICLDILETSTNTIHTKETWSKQDSWDLHRLYPVSPFRTRNYALIRTQRSLYQPITYRIYVYLHRSWGHTIDGSYGLQYHSGFTSPAVSFGAPHCLVLFVRPRT